MLPRLLNIMYSVAIAIAAYNHPIVMKLLYGKFDEISVQHSYPFSLSLFMFIMWSFLTFNHGVSYLNQSKFLNFILFFLIFFYSDSSVTKRTR